MIVTRVQYVRCLLYGIKKLSNLTSFIHVLSMKAVVTKAWLCQTHQNVKMTTRLPLLASVEFFSPDLDKRWSPAPAARPRPGTSPQRASSPLPTAPCETKAGRSGPARNEWGLFINDVTQIEIRVIFTKRPNSKDFCNFKL